MVLIIAKRMTAVKRKLTIAMMKSPQSIYTDLLRYTFRDGGKKYKLDITKAERAELKAQGMNRKQMREHVAKKLRLVPYASRYR